MATSNKEVAELIAVAGKGKRKPVYLFIGEGIDTGRAARDLIDVLVPESRRAFNLESYDGRTTSIAAVLDSVRTPGFFSGDKVVWVKESGVFLSGEKRSDITKSMLESWKDSRQQEAAEKMLTLVALAGWDEATLRETRWQDVSKTKAKEVFGDGLEDDDYEALDAIQAAAFARDLRLGGYRDEAGELAEFLEAGLLGNTILVFTSAAVDARKKIFKVVRQIGEVVDLTAERERSGSLSKATVEQVIERVLGEHRKRAAAAARELILRRAGADTAALAGELEKLCLFIGDRPEIQEAEVRENFRDMAESWVFDLTAALAARDGAKALPVLRSLFAHGEPPLRLLAMIAREVRLLLIARECLDGPLRDKWSSGLRYDAFQSRVMPQIDDETRAAFGNAHPFVLFKRFQDSSRVRAATLRDALVRVADLDMRIKSTPNDPAMLVESFVFGWCARTRTAQNAGSRSGVAR